MSYRGRLFEEKVILSLEGCGSKKFTFKDSNNAARKMGLLITLAEKRGLVADFTIRECQ